VRETLSTFVILRREIVHRTFIQKENGEVVHDSDAIMKEIRCFYGT